MTDDPRWLAVESAELMAEMRRRTLATLSDEELMQRMQVLYNRVLAAMAPKETP